MTRVASYPEAALALETGPTTRWVGPEMLVDMMLVGCEFWHWLTVAVR